MIIIIEDPKYIDVFKDNYPKENYIILNFTSLYSGLAHDNIYPLAIHINTLNHTDMEFSDYVETSQFDIDYANYILNTPQVFENLMKIIMNEYIGISPIILVHRDSYRDLLIESLIKLIQQRYSYSCWIIEDDLDFESIEDTQSTADGIRNVNDDIAKFRDLYNKGLVSSLIINTDSKE